MTLTIRCIMVLDWAFLVCQVLSYSVKIMNVIKLGKQDFPSLWVVLDGTDSLFSMLAKEVHLLRVLVHSPATDFAYWCPGSFSYDCLSGGHR